MAGNLSDISKKVKAYAFERGLFDCSNLIVGLSGGPDSVALLSILNELKSASDGSFPGIIAVHVNHMLRGSDADNDEKFCEELCKSYGFEFISEKYDISTLSSENHRSFEEMGRIKRYELFNRISDSYENSRIALAHHKDDVAETMLMNIFRGSGLDGLVSPKSINGNIIRPLLCVNKSEILEYLNGLGISYCTDATNFDSDTTRNKWRNDVIPAISKVSLKNPSDALNDTYELLSSDDDFLSGIVDKEYSRLVRKIGSFSLLNIREFESTHYSLKSRLVRKLWLDTFGNLTDFMKVHVDSVIDFCESKVSGTGSLDMPFSRFCIKVNGEISFTENGDVKKLFEEFSEELGFVILPEANLSYELGEKTTKIPNTSINISLVLFENNAGLEYNSLSWYFPLDGDISGKSIFLRSGIQDMPFTKAGSSSGRKLGKYFQDRHVPNSVRSSIAGIVIDNEVTFVPGIGHSVGFLSQASYEAWKKANQEFTGCFLRVELVDRGNCDGFV